MEALGSVMQVECAEVNSSMNSERSSLSSRALSPRNLNRERARDCVGRREATMGRMW